MQIVLMHSGHFCPSFPWHWFPCQTRVRLNPYPLNACVMWSSRVCGLPASPPGCGDTWAPHACLLLFLLFSDETDDALHLSRGVAGICPVGCASRPPTEASVVEVPLPCHFGSWALISSCPPCVRVCMMSIHTWARPADTPLLPSSSLPPGKSPSKWYWKLVPVSGPRAHRRHQTPSCAVACFHSQPFPPPLFLLFDRPPGVVVVRAAVRVAAWLGLSGCIS